MGILRPVRGTAWTTAAIFGTLQSVRGLLRAVLFLALVALIGCGGGRSVALTSYRLVTASGERDVTLPAHLDVPRGPYALRADVEVPPEWRGAFLSLTIRALFADAVLEVDGVTLPRDRPEPGLMGRAAMSHRWVLPPSTAAKRSVVLRVAHSGPREAWFDSAPRLSNDPRGDALFIGVERFNRVAGMVGIGVLAGVTVAYLALFLGDRRLRAYGWFALLAGAATAMSLHLTGLTERFFGRFDLIAFHLSILVADFAALEFPRAHFAIDRPHRAWRYAFLASAVVVVLARDEHGLAAVDPFVFAVMGTFVLAQVHAHVVAAKQPGRRGEATTLAIAWSLVAVFLAPEFGRVLGKGDPTGGLALFVPAIAMFGACQAVLLGRAHVESLGATESLNHELARRVEQLEARQSEIDLLNAELRRQIADRSRELATAMSQLGEIEDRSVRFEPGDVVEERYRVIRALGEGGMGMVYEVERIADRRRFALKIMQRAQTGRALARFAREAHLAAKITDQHLVAIVDVDVTKSGMSFFVMDLIEGGSLETARDRFGDVAWASAILRQVAHGMVALHRHGVIHRDLKPGNVLLDREGRAKIADFGVATLRRDVDALGATHDGERELTHTGSVLGTPLYMAPELSRGAREASSAVDVFAFGVLAYELLSGRMPFRIPPVLDLLSGRTPDPPPRLAVDDELATTIDRTLSLNPRERPSAVELAAFFDARR